MSAGSRLQTNAPLGSASPRSFLICSPLLTSYHGRKHVLYSEKVTIRQYTVAPHECSRDVCNSINNNSPLKHSTSLFLSYLHYEPFVVRLLGRTFNEFQDAHSEVSEWVEFSTLATPGPVADLVVVLDNMSTLFSHSSCIYSLPLSVNSAN